MLRASGYIGGIWPLVDNSAAKFSTFFYTEIENGFKNGRKVQVTKVLKKARQLFYKTGDPTFLAYAFYGDVNLEFVRNLSR